MTGPEHYAEAERLLDAIYAKGGQQDAEKARTSAVIAQVHATLALTAATIADRAFGPQEPWGGQTSFAASDEWQVAR